MSTIPPTLADLRKTIKAISPLDQYSVAVFSGYQDLVAEKQVVIANLIATLLEKYAKAKLYLVGKAPN